MSTLKGRPRRKLTHEKHVLLLALLAGLPGTVVAMVLLWMGGYSQQLHWTIAIVIFCLWLGIAFSLRERVVHPLHTLSNLLAALREGDYSIRARGARPEDALGEVMAEVNALGEMLREQRLGALEATALLRGVMAEIDVAVFAFDPGGRLRLVNRAGERLLAHPAERLLGRRAEELGLGECLQGETTRTIEKTFPGAPTGKTFWGISRSVSRQEGIALQLLVLSDLSRQLREEERKAWQRLIRVLGHELNNSLAPIISMSKSLENLLARKPQPEDWREDMESGLRVVGSRAEALSRFMEAYSRLARLPQPRLGQVNIDALVRRAASLETRMAVDLIPGPKVSIQADADQLEQVLINLLRNAVDASMETGGGVAIGWSRNGTNVEVWVQDEGPGLLGTANLFVPFYTTKPGGTGIGLVLSRQIAEAHGGTLSLANRNGMSGCTARLSLPLRGSGSKPAR
jgi:nitrogen fixation/metabolism regulation signal transduction histidine kinase